MANTLVLVSRFILCLLACSEVNAMPTKAIGTAEMSIDGTLTIHMFGAPEGANTQTVKPADPFYVETIKAVGGIKLGERKFIMPSAGQVTMNADSTISFILVTQTNSGEQVSTSGEARPGDKNYDTLLKRVGGLNPGETKSIPPY